ncbi:hypothetical protein NUM3379_06530 [Kineococcus sp. NUM-3379]
MVAGAVVAFALLPVMFARRADHRSLRSIRRAGSGGRPTLQRLPPRECDEGSGTCGDRSIRYMSPGLTFAAVSGHRVRLRRVISTNGPAAAMSVLPAFLITGIVTVTTTRAAARGDLVRNGLVGIRTRATRSSDAAREAGHHAAIAPMCWCALTCTAAAVVVLLVAVTGGRRIARSPAAAHVAGGPGRPAADQGQVRVGEGGVRHPDVSTMDGVRTPVPGRPPPRHRRAVHARPRPRAPDREEPVRSIS